MNSNKRITTILIILIYFSLFIDKVNLYSNSTKVEKVTDSKNQMEKDLKFSSYWDLTGTPILIDGNAPGVGAQNWTWFENQAWYGGGNGTIYNPYIIENITINGQGSGSCIEIRNSNVYFIIRNCTLYNSGSDLDKDGGIKLVSVNYGRVIDNNCSFNGYGILLHTSSNNNISGNIVNNNINHGIRLGSGCAGNVILRNHANFSRIGISLYNPFSTNIIYGNIVNNNYEDGIYLELCTVKITLQGNKICNNAKSGIHINHSYYTEIIDNLIDNNKDYGIYIWGTGQYARACKVSRNNITDNNYGIYLNRGSHHEIYNNSVSYNIRGLYSLESFDNDVISNIVDYNEIGIYLENSNDTHILENNINNNELGFNLEKSNNNDIFNNDVCGNKTPLRQVNCEGNKIENNNCIYPPKNDIPVEIILLTVFGIIAAIIAVGMIVFKRKILSKKIHEIVANHRTKAEVQVEKEEHFCVVHRGKIVGAMYLCPKCETFYCMKCATVLKNKGETCWSCNNKIELD